MTGRAMTLAEVAARLGVSVSSVTRLIDKGRLYRLPDMRCVRVTEQSVAAYMGERRVDSASPWDAFLSNAHAD